jgi:cell division protein FtsB
MTTPFRIDRLKFNQLQRDWLDVIAPVEQAQGYLAELNAKLPPLEAQIATLTAQRDGLVPEVRDLEQQRDRVAAALATARADLAQIVARFAPA